MTIDIICGRLTRTGFCDEAGTGKPIYFSGSINAPTCCVKRPGAIEKDLPPNNGLSSGRFRGHDAQPGVSIGDLAKYLMAMDAYERD